MTVPGDPDAGSPEPIRIRSALQSRLREGRAGACSPLSVLHSPGPSGARMPWHSLPLTLPSCCPGVLALGLTESGQDQTQMGGGLL